METPRFTGYLIGAMIQAESAKDRMPRVTGADGQRFWDVQLIKERMRGRLEALECARRLFFAKTDIEAEAVLKLHDVPKLHCEGEPSGTATFAAAKVN